MNPLEFALRMEQDGEAYYRKIAASSPDKGLSRIMLLLADEEVRHVRYFKGMANGQPTPYEAPAIRENTRNLFEDLARQPTPFTAREPQVNLYRKALELESQSEAFYRDRAAGLEPAASELFFKLTDEEHLHVLMMESIVEYVSRPDPGQWLENAEWFHSDEY